MDNLKSIFQEENKNPVSQQLQGMIDRACDSMLYEPNLALNLDICDFINQKQMGYPREAAFFILKHVNNRTSQTESMHALTLLDQCVKNCGVAFHIVISTKEFLNELVKRFPERPSPFPNQVQNKILELIQQWKVSLCSNEKFKKDLKHIEDMYNLLRMKGYHFPGVSRDAVAVLSNENQLKTEEELEAEDRAALSAKLHELLTKGTPGALEQANEIMKLLAGYEPEKKPDYKQQAQNEMEKIREKVMALSDALDNLKPKEKVQNKASIQEHYNVVISAQSKIQKMITENEDDDRLETLLQVNDLINTTLQKYEDAKSGKTVSKSDTASADTKSKSDSKSKSPTSPNKPEQQKQQASLIDFDFDGGPVGSISLGGPESTLSPMSAASGTNSGVPKSTSVNLLDDLAGLSFNGASPAPAPAPVPASVAPFPGATPLVGLVNNPAPTMQTSIAPAFAGMNMGMMGMTQPMGMAQAVPMMPMGGMPAFPAQFGMPMMGAANVHPQAAAGGFSGLDNLPMWQSSPPVNQQVPAAAKPDPFAFVQQLSTPTSPSQDVTVFEKNGLKVTFKLNGTTEQKSITAQFYNSLGVPITNIGFQVAVPKNMVLKLQPLSALTIPPFNTAPVIQTMNISNPNKEELRVRFKVSFTVNGQQISDQGEYRDGSSPKVEPSAVKGVTSPSAQSQPQPQSQPQSQNIDLLL